MRQGILLLFLCTAIVLAEPSISVKLPTDCATGEVTVYAIDQDYVWRQAIVPAQETISIPAGQFQPPFTPISIGLIQNIGAKNTATNAEITLLEQTVLPDTEPQEVIQAEFLPRIPKVGQPISFQFQLKRWPEKPFLPSKTDLMATITLPTEETVSIPVFYAEDYLFDPTPIERAKTLTPYTGYVFRATYTPTVAGKHTLSVQGTVDGETIRIPEQEFSVPQPSARNPFKGIIRVGKQDPLFFEYPDGSPFRGLGLNVRSPFDTRYMEVFKSSHWKDEGFSMFRRLFPKFAQNGINVVEIWMCSWWLALEWTHNAPGYNGIGTYNQYHAWLLDEIFRMAEKYDIYIILVINNHGKVSEQCDCEWPYNPYNKDNSGGYLDRCQDYFSDPRAIEDSKNILRYIAARWGQQPHLLAWKLFTEIDLTGPNLNWYKTTDDHVTWHKAMAQHLRKFDPMAHPITTHWMLNYMRLNKPLAEIPELDFLTTDIYYQHGGTKGMFDLLYGSAAASAQWGKPLLITEYGGSSYGDHEYNMLRQVPLGIWTGYFRKMPMPPMYWWFAAVDEFNLYSHYAALSKFASTEDRRTMENSARDFPEQHLHAELLTASNRILVYLTDTDYALSNAKSFDCRTVPETTIALPVNFNATVVQFYNPEDGTLLSTEPVTVENNEILLQLPAFQRALALKIQ